ncbi:MAG: hypothetical protein DMF72_18710 [Acidobacteria bacterium]|nr:MAG: hypothetical protein DMF72_18710 [Acidobacteriota bacterium]
MTATISFPVNFDLTSDSLRCNLPNVICRVLQHARVSFQPKQMRNAMLKNRTSNLITRAILGLAVVLITQVIVRAQTDVANAIPVVPVSLKSKDEPTTTEKFKALEEELQAQRKSIEGMRAIITEQQRVIETLLPKGTSGELKANVASDKGAILAAPSTVDADQNQTNPLEDRVKKLEGKVLSIGPFRFSGDFRLRFDGIFRKPDSTPPAGFAPLTHQQNARMRYRLRFNFDTDINPKVSFHGQLATGPINNALTMDQDFGETATRHPLFDDDIRFNGFNEKYVLSFKNNGLKAASLELRAGQYILSNPNVAIVTVGSPLALAGDKVGSTGRAANLFHQGLLLNQKFNDRWSSQFGGDIQIYRNPNQIQLASTVAGVPLIVQNGLGITLSGPLTGTGNATTTNGGAIYTARNFEIARLTYRLNWAGFKSGARIYPVTFNVQAARNVGVGIRERDAMLAAIQIGKVANRGDIAFLYVFSRKGANSMISQVTDDDLGTNSGVNIRTHHFRFDYGLAKRISLQSLLYIQNELRSSGDFPNFFVPLNAFTPRQYRLQEQIVFSF